jgi:hypothetical protein
MQQVNTHLQQGGKLLQVEVGHHLLEKYVRDQLARHRVHVQLRQTHWVLRPPAGPRARIAANLKPSR